MHRLLPLVLLSVVSSETSSGGSVAPAVADGSSPVVEPEVAPVPVPAKPVPAKTRAAARVMLLKPQEHTFKLVEVRGAQYALRAPSIKEKAALVADSSILVSSGGVAGGQVTQDTLKMAASAIIVCLYTVDDNGRPGEPALSQADMDVLMEEPAGSSLIDLIGEQALYMLNGRSDKEALALAKKG